jgi:hypothetical protein
MSTVTMSISFHCSASAVSPGAELGRWRYKEYRMFYRCFLAFCLLLPLAAIGSGLQSPADARALSDQAAALFKDEKFVEGFALLKESWTLPPVEIDGLVNQINTQWPVVRQRFGPALGVEFAKEEKAGNSFLRYTYIHKFQNHAIRWVFTYYKPKESWLVNSVTFDDQVQELFQ